MSILSPRRRVVVTGLGFISSIGNNRAQVLDSLCTQRTGIEIHPELDRPEIPYKLAGTIKDFHLPHENREAWKFPNGLTIPRNILRGLAPHGAYAYFAMNEAIIDANLKPDEVSNVRTGMMCASAGSMSTLYLSVDVMVKRGVRYNHPSGVSRGIAGTLNFNFVAAFKIRGPATGFVNACSGSSVAFGHALDL